MDRIWIGQHTDNQEGEMGALLRHTTVLLVGQVGNSNSAHCGWSQFKKIKGRKEGGFHKHNDHNIIMISGEVKCTTWYRCGGREVKTGMRGEDPPGLRREV